jgi:hypothetical protein
VPVGRPSGYLLSAHAAERAFQVACGKHLQHPSYDGGTIVTTRPR